MSILTRLEEVLKTETIVLLEEVDFYDVFHRRRSSGYNHLNSYTGHNAENKDIHTNILFHVAPKEPLFHLDKSSVVTINTLVNTVVKDIVIDLPTQKKLGGYIHFAEYMTSSEKRQDSREEEWVCFPKLTFFEEIGTGKEIVRYKVSPEFHDDTKEIAVRHEANIESNLFQRRKLTTFSLLRRMEIRIYPSAEYFNKVIKMLHYDYERHDELKEAHSTIGSSYYLIDFGNIYWITRVLTRPYNEYFSQFVPKT